MERHIDIHRRLCMALAVAASCVLVCTGETCSDEELRHDVLEFLTTRYCGSFGRRVLTNEIRFDGDTNRLAGVLSEFALTNDEWIATRAVRQLGEYGTSAQLPFLYSCATNPIVGERAVYAVMRIEGVNSNSLVAVQSYLLTTNGFPLMNRDTRTDVCDRIVKKVFSENGLSDYRPLVLDISHGFAEDVNMLPKSLDMVLVTVDPDFRYTKRRLAILRSAKARLDERIRSWNTNDVHFASEEYIYNAQTNYLFVAIGELIAYPEANLPD